MLFRYAAIFCALVALAAATEKEQIMEGLIENMKGHLKYLPPPVDTTNVTVNMYVRHIFPIDEKQQSWKLQLTFRMEWTDPRLVYTSKNLKYITYGNVEDIWIPDVFFGEEISSYTHDLLEPNNLIRISPDGHVTFSKRLTIELICNADFHEKEFVCPVRMASYMYTKSELDLEWKTDNPVQLSKSLAIHGYTLKSVATESCDAATSLGTWGCLRANFTFGHNVCNI